MVNDKINSLFFLFFFFFFLVHCLLRGPNDCQMTGIRMQWATVMGISMNIGKPLIAHLVSKEALSGIGLTRFRIFLNPLEMKWMINIFSTHLNVLFIF